MGRFEPKTFNDFLTRLTARVVARTSLTDLEIGGVLTTLLSGVARELDDLHYQMTNLQDLWSVDTATGEDLDRRAADYGPDLIVRGPATRATGTVAFYRPGSTGSTAIPSGTTVKRADGVQYTTTASATITPGNTSVSAVPAIAVVAGQAGNIAEIGILATSPGGPTGISLIVGTVSGVTAVVNDSVFTGGQDAETDAQYRDRIYARQRSLSRGTPAALRGAVLGLSLDGYGRISSAEVVEEPHPNLGLVTVFVDDGGGTIAQTATVTNEVLAASATGGEIRFATTHSAITPDSTFTMTYTSAALGTTVTLVEGSPSMAAGTYDYMLVRAQGRIELVPGGPGAILDAAGSGVGVAGLQPGDSLTITTYTHFVGLIAEAQKVVDGDPNDRATYPGFRAAGTVVSVLPPTVYWQTIEATVTVVDGYDAAVVANQVRSAIQGYVNGLPINGDVIASEIVAAAQSVPGVFDVTFVVGGIPTPLTNTIIGDGELARASASGITVNGI